MQLLIWAIWSLGAPATCQEGIISTPQTAGSTLNPGDIAGKNRTVGWGQRGAGEDPCAGVGPPAAEFLSFLFRKMRPSRQEWVARAADRIPDPPRQEAYGWGPQGVSELCPAVCPHMGCPGCVHPTHLILILCQASGFQQLLLSL